MFTEIFINAHKALAPSLDKISKHTFLNFFSYPKYLNHFTIPFVVK